MGAAMSLISWGSTDLPGEKRKWPESDGEDSPELKKPKLSTKNRLCPICLGDMDTTELMATPCAHLYHTVCLMTSFQYTNKCPVCRSVVEELAGVRWRAPVENDSDDQEEETRPMRPARRARGRRANRRRRPPTPCPSDEQLAENVQEIPSQVVNAVQEPEFEVEYSPSGSSLETIETDNDTNDQDYVPPQLVCVVCETDLDASDLEEEARICRDCRDTQGGSDPLSIPVSPIVPPLASETEEFETAEASGFSADDESSTSA